MPVKRKGITNYTSMTLQALREAGCDVDKCEKFNAYSGPFGRREDLFGFIDIIALDPTRGIIAIQSTGPSGHAAHRKAMQENPFVQKWLECGGWADL